MPQVSFIRVHDSGFWPFLRSPEDLGAIMYVMYSLILGSKADDLHRTTYSALLELVALL